MRIFRLVTGTSDICENVLLYFERALYVNNSGKRSKFNYVSCEQHLDSCLWERIYL